METGVVILAGFCVGIWLMLTFIDKDTRDWFGK